MEVQILTEDQVEVLKDDTGKELEIGAMYCCADVDINWKNEEVENLHALVRYVGVYSGRHTFADADTWEQTEVYYDKLVRQGSPVIDPTTKGWIPEIPE
jgi:hypothetical protein